MKENILDLRNYPQKEVLEPGNINGNQEKPQEKSILEKKEITNREMIENAENQISNIVSRKLIQDSEKLRAAL